MKPILFNTDRVRAIMDGRKTVTRRVVEPQPTHPRRNCIGWLGWDDGHGYRMRQPYQVGDILYVRETWRPTGELSHKYAYKADEKAVNLIGEGGQILTLRYRWHPSIHMPKEAARIFLRVTDVRVERLQDIRPVDVVNEGLYEDCRECLETYSSSGKQCCYREDDECSICDSVITTFVDLWNRMIKPADIGRYDWNANPWVWVIQFERISKEEAKA